VHCVKVAIPPSDAFLQTCAPDLCGLPCYQAAFPLAGRKPSLKAQPGTDLSTKPTLEPEPRGLELRVGRGMLGAGCMRPGGKGRGREIDLF